MSYLKGVKGNPLVTKEEYEIAKKNGIAEKTVRYRMAKGYTKSQAINTKPYVHVIKRK